MRGIAYMSGMTVRPALPADTVRTIADAAPIKVWSWLTTVFGDLAQRPGDEIGGATLGALTDGIGIRPEAMRVALHRLRKDGWIESRRVGRASLYCLSEHGRAETLRAGKRIYARTVEAPGQWHLVLIPPGGEALDAPSPVPRVALLPGPPRGHGDALVAGVAEDAIPGWARRAGIPAGVEAGYDALSTLLSQIEAAVDALDAPDGADALLLRLLTVHHWRRALLRHDDAVEQLGGAGWIGARCRARSHALLDRLPRSPADRLAGRLRPEGL